MDVLPYLYQINVSAGGIPKLPVQQAQIVRAGIEGDCQRNRTHHGGPDRALCVYAWEKILALQQEGHTISPGASGENFTIAGLIWDRMQPGNRLHIGENVVIELTSYCVPCRQNARWFSEGHYRRISQDHHPGWSRLYARVVSEGWVYQGDRVQVANHSTEDS
ncbi:MAG: MOSC domain-containing protein [Nitrospirales bacterium]|nr:MOSC domain-containing protein [Nitrospirales bacterium]